MCICKCNETPKSQKMKNEIRLFGATLVAMLAAAAAVVVKVVLVDAEIVPYMIS